MRAAWNTSFRLCGMVMCNAAGRDIQGFATTVVKSYSWLWKPLMLRGVVPVVLPHQKVTGRIFWKMKYPTERAAGRMRRRLGKSRDRKSSYDELG